MARTKMKVKLCTKKVNGRKLETKEVFLNFFCGRTERLESREKLTTIQYIEAFSSLEEHTSRRCCQRLLPYCCLIKHY